jgi:hypothetical protein
MQSFKNEQQSFALVFFVHAFKLEILRCVGRDMAYVLSEQSLHD